MMCELDFGKHVARWTIMHAPETYKHRAGQKHLFPDDSNQAGALSSDLEIEHGNPDVYSDGTCESVLIASIIVLLDGESVTN